MGATANDNVDTLQGRTMSEFQMLSDRFRIIHAVIVRYFVQFVVKYCISYVSDCLCALNNHTKKF